MPFAGTIPDRDALTIAGTPLPLLSFLKQN
jgi:hypothetical protein